MACPIIVRTGDTFGGESQMKRALPAAAMAVAMMLGSVVGAAAAPGGGGGESSDPSFTVSPPILTMSAVTGTTTTGTVVVTTKKSTAVINPATSSNALFADTQTGTCWTQYGSQGRKVPMKTGCTIVVSFSPVAAGAVSGVLSITECKMFHSGPGGGLVCDVPGPSLTVDLSGTGTTPPPVLPDLVVESITLGSGTDYSFAIHNIGSGSADLGGVAYQGWYSADLVIDGGDDGACGSTLGANVLAPGASVTIPVTCTGGPGATALYLLVVVDPFDALAESNEANNVGSVQLPQPPSDPPDLNVSSIVLTDTTNMGGWSYDATVSNLGTGPAPVGVWVIGWWSKDAIIDAGDNGACERTAASGIPAGGSLTISVECGQAPSQAHKFLIVQVDRGNTIAVTNETNNITVLTLPPH
jgi:hypothetical protein